MNNRLEDKSDAELLEITADLVKNYRILTHKFLGSTPEEMRETEEVLEGLTPAEIREAVKHYRIRTSDKIRETPESLEGLTPAEVMNAVRLNRYFKPAKLELLLELLKDFTHMEIMQVMGQYRKKNPKNS